MPIATTAETRTDCPMVMVIEDEVLIALDLQYLLAGNGWRVLGPAATVSAALGLLASEAPDVALVDVDLGGELVTPVLEALRLLDVPFLIFSAYDKGQLSAMGLFGMPQLQKPIRDHGLLAALDDVFPRSSAAPHRTSNQPQ